MAAPRGAIATAVALLATSLPARQQQPADDRSLPIAGVVVDPKGRTIADARIGTGWWFDHDHMSAYGSQDVWPAGATREHNGWRFVATDANGGFDARVLPQRRSGKVQLIAFSSDHRLGGAFAWDAADDLGDVRLVLEPVARFRAVLTCEQLSLRKVPATAYLRSYDGRRLGRFKADDGTIDLRLPPGHYSLYVYGASKQLVKARSFPFAVFAGDDVRARDIDLEPNWIAANRGRAVPLWRATEARGVDLQTTDFASFAGRWLLVQMWNCESVEPGRDLPMLIRFDRRWRREHPGQQPPYAILLLHVGGARSLAELDEQIAHLQLRENHWGGEPLPFPILLDPDERTREVWQTRWRRSTLLFDPRGRLWGETDGDDDLQLAVEGKLEPAPPRPDKKE
ncbi:MAG: hypothetical protein KAI24_13060 [Planctomycetes bacterium]|nr:hypothetical protein [Planctomycetota bacterium]